MKKKTLPLEEQDTGKLYHAIKWNEGLKLLKRETKSIIKEKKYKSGLKSTHLDPVNMCAVGV